MRLTCNHAVLTILLITIPSSKQLTAHVMRSRACVNEDQVSKMAFEIDSVVRGYHVYKDVWDAHIGTELLCLPESSNREDRYVMAVMDGDLVVGIVGIYFRAVSQGIYFRTRRTDRNIRK